MAVYEKNARQLAFEILLKTEKDKAYSNLALDAFLAESKLGERDRAFISKLVYGCIERKITLDYQIENHLSSSKSRLKLPVRIILRLGIYQLLFMDKVPSFSAVNESVELSKKVGCPYASALINAVLRKVSSSGLLLPEKDNEIHYLSVKYSCPEKLISMWQKAYGRDNTENLLISSLQEAKTSLRVNSLATNTDELLSILQKEGVKAEKGSLENSVTTVKTGSVEKLNSFKKGLFHIQDIASQLAVKALAPQPGERIIDMCSAPGGKAFTIAEEMKNTGEILAFDLYPSRTELIDKGAERLGISNITTCVCDSSEYYPSVKKADRVLCDVVCSGLGVIRRKPEIKYKELDEFKDLPDIQYRILENASKYVKSGGRLVYSTCTLNRKENDRVCDRFLDNNKDFSAVQPLDIIPDGKYYTLMPHINDCDGFFIAVFEKIGE